MDVTLKTARNVGKREALEQLGTYTETIIRNPPCPADSSEPIYRDAIHRIGSECLREISQPDFDPRNYPTHFVPQDITAQGGITKQSHTYYIRCLRYLNQRDLINHLHQYVSRYPADYVHVAHIAGGFCVMDEVLPEIGRSLSNVLLVPSEDIVNTLRPLFTPTTAHEFSPSLCLIYGGYTSRDPVTRLLEDQDQSTRWSNFMASAGPRSMPTIEIFRVISPSLFQQDWKQGKRFREDPTVSEIERVLVDSIPLWRRLNSAAGGAREVWRPETKEIDIRDALTIKEAALRIDPSMTGTSYNIHVAESVQHAHDRFKQMADAALGETKRVRSTYETYGGYAISVSALKDNTMENLNGTCTDGLSGGLSAGQAFSSWRQQLAWVHHVDDDPAAPMNTSYFFFGAILDIWHVIWIHLGWGIFIRYFCSDIRMIKPLMVYSWSSLQAAFWSRFEGMAYLEETGSAPPNQMLSPEDMNGIVGHVFIAKQGLERYHLHICDYHVGVWKYVPILRPIYARVNFLVLLLRRLTKKVLQDGITQADPTADLTTDLAWFKGRLELINSLASETGLTQALKAAKSELYEATKFYHTLRNRASIAFTSEDVEPEDAIDHERPEREDEQVNPATPSTDQVRSFIKVDLSGEAEEGTNIGSWDYILLGDPHSDERAVQIYDLQRYYMDRAERGISNIDCYLIATHDRPLQTDGSLSDALSTWLLQLAPSTVPKWAANGHGRTQAGHERAQQCRATGAAAINGPASMLSRFPDSLSTERQESCQIIDQFFTLLRSQKRFSLDNTQGLRGAVCTGCHEIIIKAGHESQKHLCRASGSWIKVDTYMPLTRFLCVDELFDFFAEQPSFPDCMEEALARLHSQTQEEHLAAIFARNCHRLISGLDYLASTIAVHFAMDATEEEKFSTAVYRSFGHIKHLSSHESLETFQYYTLTELQSLATRITYMIKYFQVKNDFQHVWRSAKCPLCGFKIWSNSSQRTNTHLCSAGGKRTKYDTIRYHESLWDGLPPQISQRIWLALGSLHKLDGGQYVSQWNPTDASCWNTTTRSYKARGSGSRPVAGTSKKSDST